MKELRFSAADGEWRVVFAFDPRRRGILLVAGDKSGGSAKAVLPRIDPKADERLDAHLERLRIGKEIDMPVNFREELEKAEPSGAKES